MDLSEIYQDIAAFADNEQDVIIEKGLAVFQRNRETYECKLFESPVGLEIEFNAIRLPYKKFLAEELGRLSILAEAIRQKRKDVDPYIDTRCSLSDSLSEVSRDQSAAQSLWEECQSRPFGETKLIFLTADAGHGKTALLRHVTQKFARAYLNHDSDMLLLHIDTQGRSFVRLEEAVARDLGQLRISGVFYSGVMRLIRRGLLAIAIDGFDELLAEIGFGEAYSGLGAFLRQLDGNGVVVASARSAYFEVENYAAQTRLLTSLPDTHVTMQLMRLQKWGREETVQFLRLYKSETGASIPDPETLYDELSLRLTPDHPVLNRPFLVSRLADMLVSSSGGAGEIANEVGSSTLEVVPNVIRALLKREVEEKWRDPSGQPYLTLDQHVHMLAAIADEMWMQGKNSLAVEVIQVVGETAVEELGIPLSRRVQVIQRLKAHALLPPSAIVSGDLSFDHEEFLNYFLAARLVELFNARDNFGIQRFCELHALPLIVAMWAGSVQHWQSKQAKAIVDRLNIMARAELRSTYLKQNAGLIGSQLAAGCGTDLDVNFVFDSLYFEGQQWYRVELHNAEFRNCTFTGLDLCGTVWKDCLFQGCHIDGLTCDGESKLIGVRFDIRCQVLGVLMRATDGEHGLRSYVPEVCREILERLGAVIEESPELPERAVANVPRDKRQALDSFFRIFSRNSGATESVMRVKLGSRFTMFRNKVLPVLVRHSVVRPTEYRGSGQQERYELTFPIELILRAEDPDSEAPSNLKSFWEELRR